MTFADSVHGRRSIRRYDTRPVPDELIREVMDLARCAPSSMDGQPCCFIVVRDAETKRRLAAIKNAACPPGKSAFPADFLVHAPVVIAVCVDRGRANDRLRENGILATGHLLLAAHACGLGGVYLSAYESRGDTLARELAALFELPDTVAPVTLIPLGFPAETPKPKSLRPLDQLIHQERYGGAR